ncbi:MAG: Fe-S cluster assembly sulfur transfer protein SufU [Nanoarchaeota archaeon]
MDDIEMMYQEQILDHYKNPRNFGKIMNATIHHHEKNPLCGDELDVYFLIDDGRNIADVKIYGRGCAISQASASMLTEKVKGKSIDEIKKLKKDDILEMLGIPISAARLKCALLSFDTFKNAILIFEKYVKNHNLK